jgi:ubiquinone/menaquinone biosynthesis C-methylase UbiE
MADRPKSQRSKSQRQDPAVPQQYEGWAWGYDLLWARYVNQTLSVLQRAARVRPNEEVLDLACGTGEFERRVLAAVPRARLVGVDLASAMVERARAKIGGHPGVRFEQADAHALPFERNVFDAVVCANTFHYFTHPAQVLRETRRVLRPGGRLVLLDWCRDFWTCRIMDAVLRRLDPAYRHCYTQAELRALLDAASFRVHTSFRYRFDLVWGMMVARATAEPS